MDFLGNKTAILPFLFNPLYTGTIVIVKVTIFSTTIYSLLPFDTFVKESFLTRHWP